MLITLLEVLSCENPECKEFGRIVTGPSGVRSYYCQICGKTSPARAVYVGLAAAPERYRSYLRRVVCSAEDMTPH